MRTLATISRSHYNCSPSFIHDRNLTDMAIKTVDMNRLAAMTGNLFESVAILSKRSRQISSKIKTELDDKLSYFEGFEQELEDPKFQEEQAKVSVEFELKSEPTEMAIDEMIEGNTFFRQRKEENDLLY